MDKIRILADFQINLYDPSLETLSWGLLHLEFIVMDPTGQDITDTKIVLPILVGWFHVLCKYSKTNFAINIVKNDKKMLLT